MKRLDHSMIFLFIAGTYTPFSLLAVDQPRGYWDVVEVESPDVARGFYEGFSNQTLWPLFHNFPYLFRFDPADWEAYREANRLFCEAVLGQLRPGGGQPVPGR